MKKKEEKTRKLSSISKLSNKHIQVIKYITNFLIKFPKQPLSEQQITFLINKFNVSKTIVLFLFTKIKKIDIEKTSKNSKIIVQKFIKTIMPLSSKYYLDFCSWEPIQDKNKAIWINQFALIEEKNLVDFSYYRKKCFKNEEIVIDSEYLIHKKTEFWNIEKSYKLVSDFKNNFISFKKQIYKFDSKNKQVIYKFCYKNEQLIQIIKSKVNPKYFEINANDKI
ncbi:hypothetical protein [Mycoplasma sp. 1654_15]|uniref:hypothetical protein n=1 Tax=Mycoplasma sp. 1654_15 TaxID=2725994 RepID=UPI0015992595|nr:hypothetical protein [Mycoplasma sp. 1654_15]QKG28185.1 hypothetical protein HF996_02640 [Mycoplasma sp. 1654_15]